MIASNIWEEILSRVEAKVNRHSFYTWFKPTAFVGDDGTTVTVRVPNALFKDWITKHYSGVIAEALDEVRRTNSLVNFVASGTPEADAPVSTKPPTSDSLASKSLPGTRNIEPVTYTPEPGALGAEDSLPSVMPTSSANYVKAYSLLNAGGNNRKDEDEE